MGGVATLTQTILPKRGMLDSIQNGSWCVTWWCLAGTDTEPPPVRQRSMTAFGSVGSFPHRLAGSGSSHRCFLSRNTARSLSESLSIRTVEFWRKPKGTLDTASPPLSLPPRFSLPFSLSALFLSVSLSLSQTFRDACYHHLLPPVNNGKSSRVPLQPPNQSPVIPI